MHDNWGKEVKLSNIIIEIYKSFPASKTGKDDIGLSNCIILELEINYQQCQILVILQIQFYLDL